MRSGILFRTQRRAPLDRVQGVNLTRPMIARLLGMAKLEVVGAGADANVKLEYLSTSNAEAVRADILRLASGRRLAEAAARPGRRARAPRAWQRSGRPSAADSPVSSTATRLPSRCPTRSCDIPIGRLIASHIISPGTVALVLAFVGVVDRRLAGPHVAAVRTSCRH